MEKQILILLAAYKGGRFIRPMVDSILAQDVGGWRLILSDDGEDTAPILQEYADPESEKYEQMIEEIRKELNFTSLRYCRLDDMLDAVGIPPENLCTYCWNGKE